MCSALLNAYLSRISDVCVKLTSDLLGGGKREALNSPPFTTRYN